MKEALLNALGVLFEKCRSEFWIYSRKFGVTWQETARALELTTSRDCKTKQEMCSSKTKRRRKNKHNVKEAVVENCKRVHVTRTQIKPLEEEARVEHKTVEREGAMSHGLEDQAGSECQCNPHLIVNLLSTSSQVG